MYIKILIALNGFATFLCGIAFILDIISKNINATTWLCLIFFILNIILFGVNVYRMKHKLY